jgi:hypothetical protein
VPVTVRITPLALSRFVQEARAQGTSPARLMRQALQNSALRREQARRRDGGA